VCFRKAGKRRFGDRASCEAVIPDGEGWLAGFRVGLGPAVFEGDGREV
jgi:hypothetical protein